MIGQVKVLEVIYRKSLNKRLLEFFPLLSAVISNKRLPRLSVSFPSPIFWTSNETTKDYGFLSVSSLSFSRFYTVRTNGAAIKTERIKTSCLCFV